MSTEKNLIFKGLEPYRDVIDDVSDERAQGDGIWVYPIKPTVAAANICAPNTIHEYTLKEVIAVLKQVADEIRNRPNEWAESGRDD